MKKKYKIITVIIALECLISAILKNLNFSFNNTLFGLIFSLVFLSPILLSFYWLSKDEDVAPKKQKICKVIFWFLIFCIMSAVIGILILLAKKKI